MMKNRKQYRAAIKKKQRVVIKIGTSTLTHKNGKLNLRLIDKLVMVISDLWNQGKDVLLVTSGAIGVGASRLGMKKKPKLLAEKQALAAIGQAQLMKMYNKFFNSYNIVAAQILLTKDGITHEDRRSNAKRTIDTLLKMKVVPIINENDTVATDEIEFGDNDTLSAYVASLINADLLILLTDIDGLYTTDPKKNKDAEFIPLVTSITDEIEDTASGAGSTFGTGGMSTKIKAAEICFKACIDTIIMRGDMPNLIFDIFEGKEIGTLFSNESNKCMLKKDVIPK